MDREVVVVSLTGLGLLAAWLIRSSLAEGKTAAAAAARAEKKVNATAQAVQKSIKARR